MNEVEDIGGMSKVYRAVGCSACSHTGYRGRKALAELLPMTEEIERLIIEGGSVEEIHRLAVSQGMSTLPPERAAQGFRGGDDPRGSVAGGRMSSVTQERDRVVNPSGQSTGPVRV